MFVRRWCSSNKKPFGQYSKKFTNPAPRHTLEKYIRSLKKRSSTIRLLCITQPHMTGQKQKKAHLLEIQINGGTISQKVDFALKLFECEIPVSAVFEESEMVDLIGVTKGKGFQGVVKRFGVTRLPRKTHRGLRKVACIGAWHPPRVSWAVARAGQLGFHNRTILHKKIYKIGKSMREDKANARCETDLTDKTITPMGGFPHYGWVRNDFMLIKGSVTGPKKRMLIFRKLIRPNASRVSQEKITLKFIDTSSKYGHGKFQTSEEKLKFLGPRKKQRRA
jgi:large subunit ribosomal protein L3e